MIQLVVSPEAEADLHDILSYLEHEAGTATALRYGLDFERAFLHLIEFPGSGAPRQRFGDTMRIWSVPPYLIFYRHARNEPTARVVRILHGHRDVSERLFKS